jgi:hypothetical protein
MDNTLEQLFSRLSTRLADWIAAIRCFMASRSGDVPRCLELGRQALEILPESNPGVLGVVQMAMGGVRILRGDFDAAIQSMREAGRLGKLAGNLQVAVTSISAVANLLMAQGKLHQAEETYREALQLTYLPDGRILPLAACVYSGLSRIASVDSPIPALRVPRADVRYIKNWEMSLSSLSRESQATGIPDPEPERHSARRVVFPEPAGAEINVRGPFSPARNRSTSLGRETSSGRGSGKI